MRVIQDDVQAAAHCGAELGVSFSHPMVGLVFLDDAGGLTGAVVLNDYTGQNIELTGVGTTCWTPKVCREIIRYAFGKLGCRRLSARTRVSNTRAQKALEKAGFVREGLARDWFPDEDAILYGLLAREQRILR